MPEKTAPPLAALSCVDLPCHPPSPRQANLALPLADSLLRSHLLACALWLVIGRFGRWRFVHSVKTQVERENRRDCPFFGAESATIQRSVWPTKAKLSRRRASF